MFFFSRRWRSGGAHAPCVRPALGYLLLLLKSAVSFGGSRIYHQLIGSKNRDK